uniref:Uncharacterized protein n=1 Tax=Catharus ustulatus TaxID=91951 RepID=A0A8C3XXN2_CATUS
MELHSLQEALKVEIQCHQVKEWNNGDLKKQIHERQSRIAALNEKQVRNRSIQLCLVFLLVFTMHYLNIRKVSALAEKYWRQGI